MKKKLIKRLEELAIEVQLWKNKYNALMVYADEEEVVTDEEENKELEEAKEVVKDWRFGKCNYLSNEIDKAIETILKHLDNEKKN